MSSQGIELQARPADLAEAPQEPSAPEQPLAAPLAAPRQKGGARPLLATLSVPAAALIGLAVSRWVPDEEPTAATRYYPIVLSAILALGILALAVQFIWPACRNWIAHQSPLLAAATLTMCAWELITLKFAVLPLPYFPGPELILYALIDDYAKLFEAAWHSLLLLGQGYLLGVIAGLISGVCIGWSSPARYWGMPILKIIGPIPATAWIPLAIVVLPGQWPAVALIALAVWFPVTMLTASGVSNVRASYLDVARTLGASRLYLIFRVAIPAAMPSIFIGLFMGLGASFLTLAAAESVGVKSGLGYYITWARDWAEYGKVFAALLVMGAFFSTIMTLLFKLRDRALVWQKGVIKW
jgi:NitT/TauT family transport system permease protein